MHFKIIIFLALLSLLPTQMMANQSSAKPNIIFIMADDLGYECLGVNGTEEYKTPHLDQLAAEGVRYTNCFANPICTATRVKLMTGLYNIRNYIGFGKLDRSQPTFAHALKKHGYNTLISGKWQLGKEEDSPQHFGFDEACLWQHFRKKEKEGGSNDSRYPNPQFEINGQPVDYKNGEYGPDICTDFILNFIEENKETPFMAYYPMILPHCPFSPSKHHPDYDLTDPGSPTYKGDTKYFRSMVEYIDHIINRITTKLDELGLRDNTIIIFTGDNGTEGAVTTRWNGRKVSGGKGRMKDSGTRVPLIINSPKLIQGGRVSDELVEFSDFFPTLCDFTKLPEDLRDSYDGASLYPSLVLDQERQKEFIYIWYGNQVMARTQDHMVLRGKYQNNPKFYDVSTLFKEKEIASKGEHQVVFESLLAEIEKNDQLRPQHLIEKDKKYIEHKKNKKKKKMSKKKTNDNIGENADALEGEGGGKKGKKKKKKKA